MIVLIHTSKTMRAAPEKAPDRTPKKGRMTRPALLDRAERLVEYVRTLTPAQLAKVMALSAPLAEKTHELFVRWRPDGLMPAAEAFSGDIYSGLQAESFTAAERTYAGSHLRILSGLYGILRPFDAIVPYRLEMGYRLPATGFASLYTYWGRSIADELPAAGPIVNLAAGEYGRTVLPYVDAARVVTPSFRTTAPKTGEPTFVAVHAKIARGAFARWLIAARAGDPGDALAGFDLLGYRYVPELSTAREPSFVCEEFGGKGMSVRLR